MPATLLCSILLSALFAVTAFADEPGETEAVEKKSEEVDAAEAGEKKSKEIDYSKLSLSKLRKASEKAADDFYSAYSDANPNDQFDVRCDYKRPTGTRRKVHSCEPRYLADMQTEHAERNWDNRMDSSGNIVETEQAKKAAEFQENLSTVVMQSPELQEKFAHYSMLVTMMAERNSR